jgi:integrase
MTSLTPGRCVAITLKASCPKTNNSLGSCPSGLDRRHVLTVRLAAFTGLRAGERVGLRVRHLDLLRGRCEVAESATEGPLREQKFVDLRHTCASLLIAQGASVNTVQAQLGLRRGRHGPTRTEGSGTILEKAEEQAADLLLVVEVGRLELWPAF